MTEDPPALIFGPYRLDLSKRELSRAGVRVHVSTLVFDLLALLVVNHDRAISNAEVSQTLWPNIPNSDRRLKDLFNRLCKILDDANRAEPRYVSREGDGYFRFIATVTAETASDGAVRQIKILYVKILHLRNRECDQPAYRTIPRDGLEPVDVFDEAQFYSLHLLSNSSPSWEWSVVTSGDYAATQIVYPWQDVPDFFDPQLAQIRSRHINPRSSKESRTYLVVTRMFNGLQPGHEDVYSKVEADAESVRLIVDFSSLADPKPRFSKRPVATVESKVNGLRRTRVHEVSPMVFTAAARDMKRGEILRMRWSVERLRSNP